MLLQTKFYFYSHVGRDVKICITGVGLRSHNRSTKCHATHVFVLANLFCFFTFSETYFTENKQHLPPKIAKQVH